MAKMMAGSILATRSSLPQTRLTPTQQLGQERDGSLQHEYRDGGEDAALA